MREFLKLPLSLIVQDIPSARFLVGGPVPVKYKVSLPKVTPILKGLLAGADGAAIALKEVSSHFWYVCTCLNTYPSARAANAKILATILNFESNIRSVELNRDEKIRGNYYPT